ncbi:MAG: ABC transporter ATP-binding protein [Nitrososphaerota archaeon]|nr:ABC transporter ATP-binding protein [Nitrososphaerota archaeon]
MTYRRGALTHQEVRAVDDFSLDIFDDETVGVVGETGSGKSTIAKVLTRLENPTRGRVFYKGREMKSLSAKSLFNFRSEVQLVFQDPYESLFPRHNVRKTLEVPLRLHRGGGKAPSDSDVAELLDLVELDRSILEKYPRELSGGMRQRLSIARALAVHPKFVILDEPVSMLDMSIRAGILNLLMRLKKDEGISYMYITHDLASAKFICDKMVIMYLGKIIEAGASGQVLDRPAHPYTMLLLDSIFDLKRPGQLLELPEREELESSMSLPRGCHFHPRCPYATDECTVTPPAMTTLDGSHAAACYHPLQESRSGSRSH